VFISRDIIFEEGGPHCTSPAVEEQLPLFDMLDTLEITNVGNKENTAGNVHKETAASNEETHENQAPGENS
jgi:hypothetical protein